MNHTRTDANPYPTIALPAPARPRPGAARTLTPIAPIAPVTPDGVPRELRDRAQWVAWNWVTCDGEHFLATPYAPATGHVADARHASTWGTFAAALRLARARSLPGVGFVLTGDDPYVVVDFAGCRCPATGELDCWADDTWTALFGSYSEVTPNGTGIRIWLRTAETTLPDVTPDRHARRTEIVWSGRFVPVTGHRLSDWDTIAECDDDLMALSRELTGHALPRRLIPEPLAPAGDTEN